MIPGSAASRPTPFQRLVKEMSAMFDLREEMAAAILLGLFRRGVFSWRTL